MFHKPPRAMPDLEIDSRKFPSDPSHDSSNGTFSHYASYHAHALRYVDANLTSLTVPPHISILISLLCEPAGRPRPGIEILEGLVERSWLRSAPCGDVVIDGDDLACWLAYRCEVYDHAWDGLHVLIHARPGTEHSL